MTSRHAVGHSNETGVFLLLKSAPPTKSDLKDAQQRIAVDNSRRSIRLQIAYGGAERAQMMYDAYRRMKERCIYGNGLAAISEALRETAKMEELPEDFTQSIVYLRRELAEVIVAVFVANENSSSFFAKVRISLLLLLMV